MLEDEIMEQEKKEYECPVSQLVSVSDALMDSFPVHWSQENEGDIEGKQNVIEYEEDTNDADAFHDLWED